jgi:hypothetical protein
MSVGRSSGHECLNAVRMMFARCWWSWSAADPRLLTTENVWLQAERQDRARHESGAASAHREVEGRIG